jgi:glutamate carboxypeptidase
LKLDFVSAQFGPIARRLRVYPGRTLAAFFERVVFVGVFLICSCHATAPSRIEARTPNVEGAGGNPPAMSRDTPSTAVLLAPIVLDDALLRAAQEHQTEFVRDLATLVSIDSGTDDAEGSARVAALLGERLGKLGAEVEVKSALPSVGKLVLARFHGNGARNLLLLAHTDTVFDHGEAARRPFRVEGARAFGPGVADAKGGVALVLHALAILRARGSANYRTLTVLFNPDEEKGSLGSSELIRTLSAESDEVLSFEPPDGERVIVATNGIAFVELKVKGRASHAGSAPEKGRNAALELAAQVLQLQELGDPRRGTTVNWTVLRSGERPNIIPENASATADMRMADMSEVGRVQKDANRIIQKHFVPDTEVTVTVDPRRPPLPKNPSSERLALFARRIYLGLGRTLEPVAMRYGTDAGLAHHSDSSRPAVLEGLGIVGDRLHTADEWADLTSVTARLYLSVRLLEASSAYEP